MKLDELKRLLAEHGLPTRPSDWLRQREGALSAELARVPGGFGLGQVPARLAPDATTRSVCGFCATGCGLEIHLRDGHAVNLSASRDYPVNRGVACPKGWEALTPLRAPDRAREPLLRDASGELRPVSWSRALDEFVARFRTVRDSHGPEAMAFLSTGQIPTEEMALLGAVAKFGMGMIHGDGNTRQCMATAATAYKQAFGFDAPPYAYADFEESDVIVLVGSNLCIAHPILWERVTRNPHDPEIVVVDPRRTETAIAATQHYPVRPKGDLLFFYSVANVLIENGWVDKRYVDQHTEGYEAFATHVKEFTPEAVESAVGLPASSVRRLAETIGHGERVSFWWTMGVNQGHEAVRTAQALIDLALLTGNMGRPGTGANSITGQCNAMGSRLFSNTTCLFGGRRFEDSDDREEVADILGIDAARIPDRPSLAYDEILSEIRAGRIRALWVIATNPAHSWIGQREVRETLEMLDVLVVQDLYPTSETARLADIVLPAAGWGEKQGTFINSERRIGLVKKVMHAPGRALADFHIFRLVAEAWGCGDLVARWKTPADVFDSLRELSRGTPCDFSGIDGYEMIEREGGIQWPFREGDPYPELERRLFEDGWYCHPNGRARFCFETPRPPDEVPDEAWPFVLLTGRGSSAQWHTQTRTSKSAVLEKLHRGSGYVEIHPADARRLGISSEEVVRLRSRRGAIEAVAVLVGSVREGELFVPMHDAEINLLTHPSFDPHSRQPSYKHCAVRIERIGTQRTPACTGADHASDS